MKIVELLIDELDNLSGFDALALVKEPAIETDFFAFKEEDINDMIALQIIKQAMKEKFVTRRPGESKESYMERCVPQLRSEGYGQEQAVAICLDTFSFDETEDPGEIVIYGYQTRHYDMCPGATSLYEAILRGDHGDIDQDLVLRAARLQDSLFYLEKHVLDMGSATEEDVLSAINLADEIYVLADMMNLREQHSYIDSHVEKIKEVANETALDIDVTGLPSYINEASGSYNFETYTDYPKQATENAKIALRYAEEHGWGDCATPVGKARANQLAKGEPISEDTVARMAAFARHRRNGQKELGDGCGRLSWLAWGGDAGVDWAIRKMEQIRREEQSSAFAFTKEIDEKYQFSLDVDKQRVIGPLMVPDKLILRVDEKGDPYYVFFSKETIQKIADKMMKNKLLDKLNIEHDSGKPVEGFMASSWIVEDPVKDKSSIYGFDLPAGSWVGEYQIENEDVWELIKDQELKGFSIEGYFADRLVQA